MALRDKKIKHEATTLNLILTNGVIRIRGFGLNQGLFCNILKATDQNLRILTEKGN